MLTFLKSRDLNSTSKRTYRRHLRAFFRWCVEQGWMERDLTADVRLGRPPEKRPKAFTKPEVDRIARAARQSEDGTWLAPLIQVAAYTGLRLGEIRALRWEHVDMEKRELRVVNAGDFQTKSGKERSVPLCQRAANALAEVRSSKGFVFTLGQGPISKSWITHRFLKYRRKALPEKEGYSFHALRHSCATWLIEAGVPVHTVSAILGHASISTTEKYLHARPSGSRRAMDALD